MKTLLAILLLAVPAFAGNTSVFWNAAVETNLTSKGTILVTNGNHRLLINSQTITIDGTAIGGGGSGSLTINTNGVTVISNAATLDFNRSSFLVTAQGTITTSGLTSNYGNFVVQNGLVTLATNFYASASSTNGSFGAPTLSWLQTLFAPIGSGGAATNTASTNWLGSASFSNALVGVFAPITVTNFDVSILGGYSTTGALTSTSNTLATATALKTDLATVTNNFLTLGQSATLSNFWVTRFNSKADSNQLSTINFPGGSLLLTSGVPNTATIASDASKLATNMAAPLYRLNPGAALSFGSVSNALITAAASTGGYGIPSIYLGFDPVQPQVAWWQITDTYNYTGGTVTVKWTWLDPVGAANKTSVWAIATQALTNGATLPTTFTAQIVVTQAVGSANNTNVTSFQFTPNWTAASVSPAYLGIQRVATNAFNTSGSTNQGMGAVIIVP